VKRQQIHRWTFIIAGIYNLCWGAYAGIDPQGFFRMAGMPPTPYPQIFACLGMVIGVYGLLYWEVARVPERGWLIAAIGLLGKVLGPIGMLWMVGTDQWPVGALWLCAFNDFIWWIPFGLYLYDAWPHFRDDIHGPNQPVTGAALSEGMGRLWLRADWDALAPAVQRLHTDDVPHLWSGPSSVVRGQGLWARMMGAPMPFPQPGDGIPLQLVLERTAMGQTWRRGFSDHSFLTFQHVRADGLLSERARFVELRFACRVEDGALVYEHQKTLFCLGPIRIPCPRFLSPRIEAREWQEEGFDGVCASVTANTAGGSLVVSYSTRLQRVEDAP
jgi:hypothetical protein